jgi:hypothetical protein
VTKLYSPERWAFEITHVLNAVLGEDRFPVDVPAVAQEYTRQPEKSAGASSTTTESPRRAESISPWPMNLDISCCIA